VTGPSLTSSTCIIAPKRPLGHGESRLPDRVDEGFHTGESPRGEGAAVDETGPAVPCDNRR